MASNAVLRDLFLEDRSALDIDDASVENAEQGSIREQYGTSRHVPGDYRDNLRSHESSYHRSATSSLMNQPISMNPMHNSDVQSIDIEGHRRRNIRKWNFTVKCCGQEISKPYQQFGDIDRNFTEHVLIDTGTLDNWISLDIVRKKNLRYDPTDHPKDEIIEFNNGTVECCGSVPAYWFSDTHGKRVPTTLYIARYAPFYVLFGFDFLVEQRIVTINRVTANTSFAFPGVRTNGQANSRRPENAQPPPEQRMQRAYKQWFKEMKDGGWKWDVLDKEFYRIETDETTGQQRRVSPPPSLMRWRTTMNP